jgi:predicted phosphate transport protein (TIGR00153 family)
MGLFFKKTVELEHEIDKFLDLIIQGALLFTHGVEAYFKNKETEFENYLNKLSEYEHRADDLRRNIESKLYLHTLIPDSRGDVLGLMESTDRVLNLLAETLSQFSVESPEIIPEVREKFIDLSIVSGKAVEQMVSAVRAYFRDLPAVRDAIAKAIFYEKESDQLAEDIKRTVFKSDLRLSHKMHQRYFALHIESIADEAENVCDRLAIAAIKRDM